MVLFCCRKCSKSVKAGGTCTLPSDWSPCFCDVWQRRWKQIFPFPDHFARVRTSATVCPCPLRCAVCLCWLKMFTFLRAYCVLLTECTHSVWAFLPCCMFAKFSLTHVTNLLFQDNYKKLVIKEIWRDYLNTGCKLIFFLCDNITLICDFYFAFSCNVLLCVNYYCQPNC